MKAVQREKRPNFDYHPAGDKLQEGTYRRDFGAGPAPGVSHYTWRVVKDVNELLLNIQIAFKYMDMERCSEKYLQDIQDPD